MGCGSSGNLRPVDAVQKTAESPYDKPKAPVASTRFIGNYKGTVHDEFVKASADGFFGRAQLVQEIISKFIATTNNSPPLVLHSKTGMGKSYVLAAVARKCMEMAQRQQLPNTTPGHPPHVFYHFFGSVPGSTDLLPMLRRLLFETQIVQTEWDLPSKLEDAVGLVCSSLTRASTESYVIILDGLQSIDEVHGKDLPLSWIPIDPPPNVKLVVSSSSESCQFGELKEFYKSWTFKELEALDFQAKLEMINHRSLKLQRKIMEDRELQLITSNAYSDNLLWLTLATEEIAQLQDASATTISNLIFSLPSSLEGLENKALTRIEGGTYGDYCVATLCLLECSVNGLDLEELSEMLSAKPRLPDALYKHLAGLSGLRESKLEKFNHETWNQIEALLGAYVRMHVLHAKHRLDFFHSSFARTVRQRYLLSGRKRDSAESKAIFQWYHSRLAYHFRFQCKNTKRRCECYPIHAHRSKNLNGLEEFLSDWEHFDQMFLQGFSRPLNKAWTYVHHLQAEENLLQYGASAPTANKDIFKPMEKAYVAGLEKLYPKSNDSSLKHGFKDDIDKFISRLENVARILNQNGCYASALDITDRLIEFTDFSKELDISKTERLRWTSYMFLKGLIIYGEVTGQNFVDEIPLSKCATGTECFERAVRNFKADSPTDDRIGQSLIKMAFLFSLINLKGGTEFLSAADAQNRGFEAIDGATEFYLGKAGQQAKLAECYVTQGSCEDDGSNEQIKCYNTALKTIVEEFGHFHPQLPRIYLNMGIFHEVKRDHAKAYDLFRKWYNINMRLYGPTHPLSIRAIKTLQEDAYRKIAIEKGDPVPSAQSEIQNEVDSDFDD